MKKGPRDPPTRNGSALSWRDNARAAGGVPPQTPLWADPRAHRRRAAAAGGGGPCHPRAPPAPARGPEESLEGDPDEGFRQGKLPVVLHGQKVQGEIHLVRTRMAGRGKSDDGTQWLLFKKRDTDAVPGWSLPTPSRSVKSGRSIEEIKRDEPARWSSSPAAAATAPKIPRGLRRLGLEKSGTDAVPRGVQPMLAKLIDEPFDDPDWVFEPTWDGGRTSAIDRKSTRLNSSH